MLFITAVLTVANFVMLKKGLERDADLTKSSTQTMYADKYPETGEFPDLFLRNIVKGKTVKVARKIKTYNEYGTYGRDEEEGNPFDRHYLTDNDYTRWFELYAGEVVVDESLPAGDETGEMMAAVKEDFRNIGAANDMLRYSFPLNTEKVQQASAFWYSWYYNAYAEKLKKEKGKDTLLNIYVNLDDASSSDTFVAVWDNKGDLYFMSEDTYRALH